MLRKLRAVNSNGREIMNSNRQYQTNMKNVATALYFLNKCRLSGELRASYRVLDQAHWAWERKRRRQAERNGERVRRLYATKRYSPVEIADMLKMNYNDVSNIIMNITPSYEDVTQHYDPE